MDQDGHEMRILVYRRETGCEYAEEFEVVQERIQWWVSVSVTSTFGIYRSGKFIDRVTDYYFLS
jgi:hypothetical protein